MKILYFILFLSLSTLSFGQEESKSMASVDVLTGFMSQVPRVNVGYIHRLNKTFWLGLDVGYGSRIITKKPILGEDYQLFEIRPEIYVDLRPSKKLKHLLSFEIFYIHHTDFYKNEWFIQDESFDYTFDTADYKRIKTGFNFNYNLFYYIGSSNRFALMQKVGIGLRNRKVEYNNVTNPQSDERKHWFNGLSGKSFINKEGEESNINLNLAFKLIYIF